MEPRMKIAVSGAAGRMGRRIIALGYSHPEMQISGAIEASDHPAQGNDAGELAGIGRIGVPVASDTRQVLQGCDCLIDFSAPAASVEHVQVAASLKKAVVVGTTGFSDEQKSRLVELGSTTRCVIAPNMSPGVNLLYRLVEQVARAFGPEYDVEIVESHHRMKKDAPSGTAEKLAQIVAQTLDREFGTAAVYGRHGMVGERKPQEIGVMAVRGGDIVGEHTVMFITEGERIELIHRAHSRDALARGAIRAALWLVPKPVGIYDMQDVLGLKVAE
jgi:4-hydroxy-tetrahydrodipicolinate reductase